jgi:hypothetical protein
MRSERARTLASASSHSAPASIEECAERTSRAADSTAGHGDAMPVTVTMKTPAIRPCVSARRSMATPSQVVPTSRGGRRSRRPPSANRRPSAKFWTMPTPSIVGRRKPMAPKAAAAARSKRFETRPTPTPGRWSWSAPRMSRSANAIFPPM